MNIFIYILAVTHFSNMFHIHHDVRIVVVILPATRFLLFTVWIKKHMYFYIISLFSKVLITAFQNNWFIL